LRGYLAAISTAPRGGGSTATARPRTGGLHRNSIAEIIKRWAAAVGLEDAPLWGGRSLRRGFATEAITAGAPERDVQRHGRWRSRASMDP
jgi:integrase